MECPTCKGQLTEDFPRGYHCIHCAAVVLDPKEVERIKESEE